MPARVEKLMGQPIVQVTYYGNITLDDAKTVIANTAALLDDYGAPLYRIICVDCEGEAHASFDEVMMVTTLSSKGMRGSVTDPDVYSVLVGEHLLIDLYVDAMGQEAFGAVNIPLFETVDEAMIHIREQIHQNGRTAGTGAL